MADQIKKAETKNQHFVPQFYQRYFSMDKKNIGTYIISSGKNINSAPIKNQSSGNYFYSDKMEIEKILGKMEGIWKKVIDKVIKNPKGNLSREEKYNLYAFTIIQLGRTSAQANLIQEAANTSLCTIAKKHLEILRNSENSDKYKDITDDELNHISFNFPYPAVLALQTQFQLINTCIDLQFKILINNTKVSFITSNNPAAKYSQFLERMGVKNYALGSRGLQIFIPLTPLIGVMFYDPKCYKLGYRRRNYVELTQEKDIEELNKLTASNAEGVLYYLPGSISENQLEKLSGQNKYYKPQKRVEEYPEIPTADGVIVGSYHCSLFCKLSLSFVKELPRYRTLRKQDFNCREHLLREIAYIKDEIARKTI